PAVRAVLLDDVAAGASRELARPQPPQIEAGVAQAAERSAPDRARKQLPVRIDEARRGHCRARQRRASVAVVAGDERLIAILEKAHRMEPVAGPRPMRSD